MDSEEKFGEESIDRYSVEMEEESEKENDEELEKEFDEYVGKDEEEIEGEACTKNDDQNSNISSVKRVRNNYEEEEDSRPKKIPKTLIEKTMEKRLIIVLENASLETVKVHGKFELLNCDDHKRELSKYGRDISTARPDIVHQCLMMLLDSPLNRAGLLQVYIHTSKNVLIEVNPRLRIPRTFTRFCGLMVQLLHKLSIHASDGPVKLMKVIKNPITNYLPAGSLKISTSYHAEQKVDVKKFSEDKPVVFVIGAMAHGKVQVDYTEQEVSISGYPLSAALVCTKICSSFEEAWNVQ